MRLGFASREFLGSLKLPTCHQNRAYRGLTRCSEPPGITKR